MWCAHSISARWATHSTPRGCCDQFEYVEHCPPDVGAIKPWLTNRGPAEWSDKQAHEHDVGSAIADLINSAKQEHDE